MRHHRIEFAERREIGGFAVECIQVEHRVPTMAVRITHRGRTIAFSADSLPCEGLSAAARNADLFICDTMCANGTGILHAIAHEVSCTRRRGRLQRFPIRREPIDWRVSISRGSGSAQNILEEEQTVFGGRVEVPNDGDRYLI